MTFSNWLIDNIYIILVWMVPGLFITGLIFGYTKAWGRAKSEMKSQYEANQYQVERLEGEITRLSMLITQRDAKQLAVVDAYTGWDHVKNHGIRSLFTTIQSKFLHQRKDAGQVLEASIAYFNYIMSSCHWSEYSWAIADELHALDLYCQIFFDREIVVEYDDFQTLNRDRTCIIPLILTVLLQNAIDYAFTPGTQNTFRVKIKRTHLYMDLFISYKHL